MCQMGQQHRHDTVDVTGDKNHPQTVQTCFDRHGKTRMPIIFFGCCVELPKRATDQIDQSRFGADVGHPSIVIKRFGGDGQLGVFFDVSWFRRLAVVDLVVCTDRTGDDGRVTLVQTIGGVHHQNVTNVKPNFRGQCTQDNFRVHVAHADDGVCGRFRVVKYTHQWRR